MESHETTDQSHSNDEPHGAPAEPTKRTIKRPTLILLAVILIAIIAIAALVVKNNIDDTPDANTNQNASVELTEDEKSLRSKNGLVVKGVRSYTWVMEGGEVIRGSKDIEAIQGENVAITITADDAKGETFITIDNFDTNTEVAHSNGFGLLAFNANKVGKYNIYAEVIHEEESVEGEESRSHETTEPKVVIGTLEVKAN